ncbi:MAG TPA: hypothetical protein EYP09_06700, partial [Anaerolineae bacterium]|nr:hypothetical protein [Anaerolineae bacterium]
MTVGDKIFIGDRLILDPATGSLSVVFQAVPLLQGARAEVSYRLEGKRRRLSLLGRGMAYKIEREGIVLSRANGQVRLDWHLILGPGVEAWLEVSNIGQDPVQLDELVVLFVDAAQGGAV